MTADATPPTSPTSPTSPRAPLTRTLAAIEISVVVALILAITWRYWHALGLDGPARSVARAMPAALIAAVVLISLRRQRDTLADLGLQPRQWLDGWRSIILFTLPALALIIIVGSTIGSVRIDADVMRWMTRYIPGLFAQQLLLQCFLNRRIQVVLGHTPDTPRPIAVVTLCTVLFTLAHLPNPLLTLLTAVAGAVWCMHFVRHRNLVAVMISHLLLGTACLMFLGQRLLLNLRVGMPAWERLTQP